MVLYLYLQTRSQCPVMSKNIISKCSKPQTSKSSVLEKDTIISELTNQTLFWSFEAEMAQESHAKQSKSGELLPF